MEYESNEIKFKFFTSEGFNVKFPFEPYNCQKEIVKSILKSLKNKTHSIIESPTGTGKCLSALSAVTAYINELSKDKSYLEEKKKSKNIITVLMMLEEANINLNKLYKKFKNREKKNSVNKSLQYFLDIKSENNKEKEILFSSIYINWEKVINLKSKLLFIIASEVCSIFNKFEFDHLEEREMKFNSLLEMLEICVQKLKDQLKTMKHSHSVLYAVRTSSQIDIVFEESQKLKEKKDNINISFLKSRNFYCINDKLKASNGTAKNRICKKSIKNNKCSSYAQFKAQKDLESFFDPQLVNYKKQNICPYYNEKEISPFSEIIVCSYNHLFNHSTRQDFLDYLVNPIIIFDEAHNVPSACEDFLNFKFNIKELISIADGIFTLAKKLELDTINFKKEKNNQMISSQEEEKEENIDEKFMQIIKKFLIFLIVISNNIIFINQICENTPLIDDAFMTVSNLSKLDYCSTFIFDIFSKFVSYDHFKIYKENELNYASNLLITNESEESTPAVNSYEENIKLIRKFESTLISLKNYQKVFTEFQSLANKYIDMEDKVLPFLDKIINVFGLFYEILLTNFERVVTNTKLKRKLYIEDYYLTLNKVEFIKKEKHLLDNFLEFKNFVFMEKGGMEQLLIPETSINQIKSYFEIMKEFCTTNPNFLEKSVNLICMNPAICFGMMKFDMNPRSIILLSGTMSPFDYYSNQLNLTFTNSLQNEHIINSDQVQFYVFNTSIFNTEAFEISYTKKNIDKYDKDLYIETLKIINYMSTNSGSGNLVFIKTYPQLEKIIEYLIIHFEAQKGFKVKKTKECIEIIKDRKIYKKFYCDSREVDSSMKEKIMTNYKRSCKEGVKTYLLSVMRGLFSEGVNFDDEESSMIFLLGIPFPDITDDYIRLKMEYVTEKFKKGESPFCGDDWYSIQAMTALNQAIGRAIRRKNDFSTICILESRILSKKINKLLSKWLQKVEMNIVDRYNYQNLKLLNKAFYKKYLQFSDEEEDEEESLQGNEFFVKNQVSVCKINKQGNTGFVTFSFK